MTTDYSREIISDPKSLRAKLTIYFKNQKEAFKYAPSCEKFFYSGGKYTLKFSPTWNFDAFALGAWYFIAKKKFGTALLFAIVQIFSVVLLPILIAFAIDEKAGNLILAQSAMILNSPAMMLNAFLLITFPPFFYAISLTKILSAYAILFPVYVATPIYVQIPLWSSFISYTIISILFAICTNYFLMKNFVENLNYNSDEMLRSKGHSLIIVWIILAVILLYAFPKSMLDYL